MVLDTSSIVRVTTQINPGAVAGPVLGRTLLLVRDDDFLDPSGAGRVRRYTNAQDVAEDFEADSVPYLAAQVYFAQSPFPRNLFIGNYAATAKNEEVRGGTPSSLSVLQAISTGSFRVNGVNFTGLDLSSVTDLAGVATALQTLLRTGTGTRFTGAQVTYDAMKTRFEVRFGGQDTDGTVFTTHSTAVGVDVSDPLGLDAGSGATYHPGGQDTSVAAALDDIVGLDSSFYFVTNEASMNAGAANDEALSIAAWTEANARVYAAESNEMGALTTGEVASVLYTLSQREYGRTFITWSEVADYKALSIAGRLSSVDFEQPASYTTAKFKTLPGTTPDSITPTQAAELDRKRCNYYANYGATPIYSEGYMSADGLWVDVRYWLDWLRTSIQTDLFNLLRASASIPLTSGGVLVIKSVIAAVMERGRRNGGITAGVTISEQMAAEIAAATGQPANRVLPSGYYTYVGSVAAQSDADRTARRSPPVKVWMRGSGAVHSIDVALTFEN